jgi:hypothetical protein
MAETGLVGSRVTQIPIRRFPADGQTLRVNALAFLPRLRILASTFLAVVQGFGILTDQCTWRRWRILAFALLTVIGGRRVLTNLGWRILAFALLTVIGGRRVLTNLGWRSTTGLGAVEVTIGTRIGGWSFILALTRVVSGMEGVA